jgi:hypothetical protein
VHVPHAMESSAHHLVGETMRRVELGDTHAQTLTQAKSAASPMRRAP